MVLLTLNFLLPALFTGSLSGPLEESAHRDGASLVQSALQDTASVCARETARSSLHRQPAAGIDYLPLPSVPLNWPSFIMLWSPWQPSPSLVSAAGAERERRKRSSEPAQKVHRSLGTEAMIFSTYNTASGH